MTQKWVLLRGCWLVASKAELIVRGTETAVDGDVDVLAGLNVEQPRTVGTADRRRLGGTERGQVTGHGAYRYAAEHRARVLVGHLHCMHTHAPQTVK